MLVLCRLSCVLIFSEGRSFFRFEQADGGRKGYIYISRAVEHGKRRMHTPEVIYIPHRVVRPLATHTCEDGQGRGVQGGDDCRSVPSSSWGQK